MVETRGLRAGAVLALTLLAVPVANAQPAVGPIAAPTYADLADMADSAPLVVRAQVRKVAAVPAERAPGLLPGTGRFYIQAQTEALLSGNAPIGEALAYLVDLPLDARGKPPPIKKTSVLIFARPVPGRPGELQLVKRGAQLPATPGNEARIREILSALVAPDAPAKVNGLRELIYVPGTLAGEGETQMFLSTADSSAASITVRHEPGQPTRWGVSFSELVANVDQPPRPGTLEWYRLACFLPPSPPADANLSQGLDARRLAVEDYRLVLRSLGPCERNLG